MRNIVFILADQLGASALGCYGGSVDSTPTLDRLAETGTRFTRHYCSHPSCSPSRASFLTGRSAAVHGVVDNNYVLDPALPTYARVLGAHGYHTGLFGKIHQTPMMFDLPESFAHLGFDESIVTEDPKWGPWIDWVASARPDYAERALSMCWDPAYRSVSSNRRAEHAFARATHLLPRARESNWRSMYESPIPAELHDSAFIADRAIDFMARHLEARAGEPFLCHVSFVDPHDPYDPPAPYSTLFHSDAMPDPLPAEWIEEGLQAFADRSYIGFDAICSNIPVIREWRALFHGELRFLDDQVARIESFLRTAGILDDTVIVFASDHGEMLGDHELIAKHTPQYDAGIRCPLIVHGAGIAPSERDELVSTLDFFPTFCEWAGVPRTELPPLEGRSFAPSCDDQASAPGSRSDGRRGELSVSGTGVETLISDDNWRLTLFHRTREGQLFDLTADPGEQTNLYDDPRFAVKRAELYEQMVTAMARPRNTADFRALPKVNGSRRHPGALLGARVPDYSAGLHPPSWGVADHRKEKSDVD